MYDSVQNDQFPRGGQAYAAYVDGSVGDQPNFAFIVATFPAAYHLSIALFAASNADALDVEPGASTAAEFPAWYSRQKARGVQRPCVYASASMMTNSILPMLSQANIALSSVRLWSAHYGLGEHMCGPDSCGAVPVGVDGTQWTSSAQGLNLDQSQLKDDFFSTDPSPTTEAELQSGSLELGRNGLTIVSVAQGTASRIAFGCDNSVKGLPPAVIRLAIYDTGPGWRVTNNIHVDGNKGQTIITFPNPSKTGVLSIIRADNGDVQVGYVVY